jgi:hypothetical protein
MTKFWVFWIGKVVVILVGSWWAEMMLGRDRFGDLLRVR